nr:MAG TPA: tail protein [Caudoviricetes sp.]
MIKIFNSDDTVFASNGNVVINPTRALVHKEDNGEFYLDLECSIKYVDYIVGGNIIVAPTPQGEQAFRINNPTKTSHKITAKCQHVSYDTANYLILDSNIENKDCDTALKQLNSATEPSSPFLISSDIATVDSYRCVRQSLYEAIQSVIEQWGGHLVRDNFNIELKSSIGDDNGVTVQYAKNLKEISCEQNWDSVVTKLLPTGKDDILLNAIDEKADIYVTSSRQYAIPYVKTVSFNQDHINEEDYQDSYGDTDEEAYKQALVDDLKKQAQSYVETNSVPQVNYTLKANLDKLTDIGDVVEVKDERLGINILTHVIKYEYDCILERYTELEFGNFSQSLSGLVSNITESVSNSVSGEVKSVKATLEKQLQDINKTMEGSYLTYDGNEMLILDKLPKETAEKVMKLDKNGVSLSKAGIDGAFSLVYSVDGTLNVGGSQKNTVNVLDEQENIIARISENGIEANGINLEKSVATLSASANVTELLTNGYSMLPLLSEVIVGKRLTASDGGVKINDANKVLISGRLALTPSVDGIKDFLICRNSASDVLCATESMESTTSYSDLVIAPTLCEVNKDDVIYVYYRTEGTNDLIKKGRTTLTVEVVE